MKKKLIKKICIIGPALKMGGIERESVNFANSLSSEEFDVSFLALFKSNHFFRLNSFVRFYEPNEFNVKALNIFKTLQWVRKIVCQIEPDGIIVYNKFYGAVVSLALLFTKYKIVVSEASSPIYQWPLKQRLLNRVAYSVRPPEAVKAQTQVSFTYLRKYYNRKTRIKVIPNPLREVKLYPELNRKKWILAAGRFGDPLKGFDRLIDAFAKVKANDWVLVFAGGDEDGQYLKNRAATLEVLDKIIFLGKVSEIDIVYAQASIFVMPSRSEGFPNALCEAMGAGLPCISFDFISGPKDMITDGVNGILVKDGDIDALAKAIDNLIVDENKRYMLGNNAMEVRRWLDQNKIGGEVLKFLLGQN